MFLPVLTTFGAEAEARPVDDRWNTPLLMLPRPTQSHKRRHRVQRGEADIIRWNILRAKILMRVRLLPLGRLPVLPADAVHPWSITFLGAMPPKRTHLISGTHHPLDPSVLTPKIQGKSTEIVTTVNEDPVTPAVAIAVSICEPVDRRQWVMELCAIIQVRITLALNPKLRLRHQADTREKVPTTAFPTTPPTQLLVASMALEDDVIPWAITEVAIPLRL